MTEKEFWKVMKGLFKGQAIGNVTGGSEWTGMEKPVIVKKIL